MCSDVSRIRNRCKRGGTCCTAPARPSRRQNDLHAPRCFPPSCGRCRAVATALARCPYVCMHCTYPAGRGTGVHASQPPQRPSGAVDGQPNLRPPLRAVYTCYARAAHVLYNAMQYTIQAACVQRGATPPSAPNAPPGKCLDQCRLASRRSCRCCVAAPAPVCGLYLHSTAACCTVVGVMLAEAHARQHGVCAPPSSRGSSRRQSGRQ